VAYTVRKSSTHTTTVTVSTDSLALTVQVCHHLTFKTDYFDYLTDTS